MQDELTGAVPKDDNTPAATGAAAETDTDDAAQGESDLDAADLAAVAEEDDVGSRHGIPKARFDEVNERKKELHDENMQLRQLLANVTTPREATRETAPAVAAEKPRDFEAEFVALKQKYDGGSIDDDEYRKAERDLIRAEAKFDAMQQVKPLAHELATERQRIATERVTTELGLEAAKAYAKFPFLDHTSPDKNDKAIAAVLKERDELIATGVAPTKALRLAVAEIAPEFGTAVPASAARTADEVAAARRAKARIDAGAADTAQPAALVGVGNGGRAIGVQRLGASVKDNEKWLKIPESERSKAFTA